MTFSGVMTLRGRQLRRAVRNFESSATKKQGLLRRTKDRRKMSENNAYRISGLNRVCSEGEPRFDFLTRSIRHSGSQWSTLWSCICSRSQHAQLCSWLVTKRARMRNSNKSVALRKFAKRRKLNENPRNTGVPRFSAVVMVGSSTEQDMMVNGRGGKMKWEMLSDADQKVELEVFSATTIFFPFCHMIKEE